MCTFKDHFFRRHSKAQKIRLILEKLRQYLSQIIYEREYFQVLKDKVNLEANQWYGSKREIWFEDYKEIGKLCSSYHLKEV